MLDLWPCALCGAPSRELLCSGCELDLPRPGPLCVSCGLPSPVARCGACCARPSPWDRCIPAYLFEFPMDRILHAFKYRGALFWARHLARGIVRQVSAAGAPLPQGLIPVPVTPARLAGRGYNQALELARHVGSELDIPVIPGRVRRVRAETSQVGLGVAARAANVRGTFVIDGTGPLPGHVAVVDDLVTTGATAGAVTRLLTASGVIQVQVWTAARTPSREIATA